MELDDWDAIDKTKEDTRIRKEKRNQDRERVLREAAQKSHSDRSKTESLNGMLFAMYYLRLKRWKENGGYKTNEKKPEPPSNIRLPSSRQINYLQALTGTYTMLSTLSFVEYANALPSGFGFYPNYAEKGAILLSRKFWMKAITLAKTGSNTHGTDVELVIQSFGDPSWYN